MLTFLFLGSGSFEMTCRQKDTTKSVIAVNEFVFHTSQNTLQK